MSSDARSLADGSRTRLCSPVKKGSGVVSCAKITPSAARGNDSRPLFHAALPLRGLLRLYRLLVSPLVGPHCRFHPSCSRYADEALARHGLVRGGALALRRVSRCHARNPGGFDPVPETF